MENDEERNREMIERISAGDTDAIAKFIEIYAEEIRRFVEVKMRKQKKDLREISIDRGPRFSSRVQSIVHSTISKFLTCVRDGKVNVKQSGYLLKYLLTIARNEIAQRDRNSLTASSLRDPSDAADLTLEKVEDEETVLDYQVLADILVNFKVSLSREEQILLDLRSQGVSYKSISDQLSYPVPTLRSMLAKIKTKIRNGTNYSPTDVSI